MTKATKQAAKAIEEAKALLPGALDEKVPEAVRENLRKLMEDRLSEALAFLQS